MRQKIEYCLCAALLALLLLLMLLNSMEADSTPPVIQTRYLITSTAGMETIAKTTVTETECLTATTTAQTITHIWLNEATLEELMCVEGIGEVLANRIITRRSALGGFHSVEELMQTEGIGEVLASRLLAVFSLPDAATNTTSCVTTVTTAPSTITTTAIPTESIAETTAIPAERPFLELNAVTYADLMTVPGMTETYANSILALRETIHYFSHPYELLYAEGMTREWLSEVIDCFYVEGVNDGVVFDTRAAQSD